VKDLAIILLNWNDDKVTLNCVDTIKSWKYIAPEIIIVDNHSDDERLRSSLHPFNACHFIHNPINGGFAGGNNLGIKKALQLECSYILLLNTDATISEVLGQHLAPDYSKAPDIWIESQPQNKASDSSIKVWDATNLQWTTVKEYAENLRSLNVQRWPWMSDAPSAQFLSEPI